MAHDVLIPPQVAAEIKAIGDYIAQDNPVAARAMMERLYRRCLSLDHFPERGRPYGTTYRAVNEGRSSTASSRHLVRGASSSSRSCTHPATSAESSASTKTSWTIEAGRLKSGEGGPTRRIAEGAGERVLLGASLGAVASLSTAFRFPGVFGGLVLKSGRSSSTRASSRGGRIRCSIGSRG